MRGEHDNSSLDTVLSLLRRVVFHVDDDGLTADTELLDSGLLNSFALTDLVASIHEELGVAIPSRLLVPATFHSARALSAVVTELVAGAR